uniref:C-type lectin domain-containing protein n=1 Tax=Kryptolebias marmoratus TaxID=37003 RepID=A0A3Q3AM50_KRYMA
QCCLYKMISLLCVRAGMLTATPATGWKRRPGVGLMPKPSARSRAAPCWMRFRNKCFMFKGQGHDLKANWSDAQSWCKEQGGELASECGLFASPDFVASYLRDLRFPTWIGLSDQLSENQYAWSDNSPVLYTNWNENEPNNAGGAEHCVAMTHNMLSTGRWNDDACHKNHSFVCYRKKCK